MLHGDSKLIIDFLLGTAKPQKGTLMKAIKSCKHTLSHLPAKVQIAHVARELNLTADWLSKEGLRTQTTQDILEALPNFTAQPDEVNAYFPASEHEDPCLQHICSFCGIGTLLSNERECWGCRAYVHPYCILDDDPFASEGPWYCPPCTVHYRSTKDITLDAPLMRLLIDGIQPPNDAISSPLQRSMQFIQYEGGKLQIWRQQGAVIVPAIKHRYAIISETAQAVGFTSGDRLYALLRETYWWTSIRKDCLQFCRDTLATQVANVKFKSPPYLFPTNKGLEPFQTWCIDCMTNLQPPDPGGGTTIILAIDAWSKWTEYKVINPLDSKEAAKFLYEDIICRFGVPAYIRRD